MTERGGVIRFVDKDNKNPRKTDSSAEPLAGNSEADELYRRLQPEMRRPKPSADAIAAALESAQRLAAEMDAEDTAMDMEPDSATILCQVCGYRNREGNKFCGMCGVMVVPAGGVAAGTPPAEPKPAQAMTHQPSQFPVDSDPRPPRPSSGAFEAHHYHHHYHHHYFPGGSEIAPPSGAEPVRKEKIAPTAALRGDMSRAEAAVRRITQEWVLACNTKHLDDLLDLYTADALVLRSNYPPVRGAAAIREFFFGALDAGLGEVEVDPLRVDVVGELAYEAGRCKALIPSATGKRREERGKYLWVCARQSNGEWKLVADCWSSDLTLGVLESDVPPNTGVRTSQPRKSS